MLVRQDRWDAQSCQGYDANASLTTARERHQYSATAAQVNCTAGCRLRTAATPVAMANAAGTIPTSGEAGPPLPSTAGAPNTDDDAKTTSSGIQAGSGGIQAPNTQQSSWKQLWSRDAPPAWATFNPPSHAQRSATRSIDAEDASVHDLERKHLSMLVERVDIEGEGRALVVQATPDWEAILQFETPGDCSNGAPRGSSGTSSSCS